MNKYLPGNRITWLAASLLLALGLPACTEEKKAVIPPAVPPVLVVNQEPKSLAQYTELVWSDEFNGDALDQSKWTPEMGNNNGWGNQELQNYTGSPDNISFSGGNLVIHARKQQLGGYNYTSARLITKGKRDFVYGRIDVRAKLPKGKGIWPAIWMLGSNIDQVNWPRCGEIDIMELRGSKPKELISTMHFANSTGQRELRGFTKLLDKDISEDFHVFSIVRSKGLLRFYFDEQEYYSFTGSDIPNYPFNNPFFLILNLAVGGQFDGDPTTDTVFPQQLQVDYARYYQYK